MHRLIELLVFAAEGNVYGVHANQVEEFLAEGVCPLPLSTDAPFSFLYKRRQLRIVRLAQYMRQRPIIDDVGRAAAPSALSGEMKGRILVTTIRRDDVNVGLLIDELLQLVSLPIEKLFPLPKMMEITRHSRLIWGIALPRETPVIVLDLEHLS